MYASEKRSKANSLFAVQGSADLVRQFDHLRNKRVQVARARTGVDVVLVDQRRHPWQIARLCGEAGGQEQ